MCKHTWPIKLILILIHLLFKKCTKVYVLKCVLFILIFIFIYILNHFHYEYVAHICLKETCLDQFVQHLQESETFTIYIYKSAENYVF